MSEDTELPGAASQGTGTGTAPAGSASATRRPTRKAAREETPASGQTTLKKKRRLDCEELSKSDKSDEVDKDKAGQGKASKTKAKPAATTQVRVTCDVCQQSGPHVATQANVRHRLETARARQPRRSADDPLLYTTPCSM